MIKGQVAYDLMSRLPGDIWDFDADADDGCSMVQTVAVESHVWTDVRNTHNARITAQAYMFSRAHW